MENVEIVVNFYYLGLVDEERWRDLAATGNKRLFCKMHRKIK